MLKMSKKVNRTVSLFLIVLLLSVHGIMPVKAVDSGDEERDVNVLYHETFENEQGLIKQAGEVLLETVSGVEFEGNENGNALYVSNRSEGWNGLDISFSDVGMEDGKTYEITVRGYIDEEVKVPDGSQALMQNIDSYEGLYLQADYEAGEAFILEGEHTVDTNKDNALRIQSNENGKTVPFYIGELRIAEIQSSEEETDEERPAEEFSVITFENQELSGFEARGETETLTVTDEANHTDNGSYALKVEDRSENWNGPSLRVEQYIEKGQEYNISAWVKLISPDSSQLQLSTQIGSEDAGASYNNIQGTTVNKDDGWVQLKGSYRYNGVGDDYVTIYVESSNNSSASFYIDDVRFEPAGTGGVEIEKDLTPIKDVYKEDFLIGNAVSQTEFEGKRLELLQQHHNLVTAENAMKPGYAYNDELEFDFAAEDALIDRTLEEGLLMHGHVLVWHQQSEESLHTNENGEPLPREEALKNLRTHVKTTVQHFGANVISWDVVNEAMNDNPSNPSDWEASLRQSGWFHAIGPEYIEESFRAAREALDELGMKDITLYYNDYNDDNQNKAEAIYQMVKDINENYAAENDGERLIDGIGMQAHYNLNTNPENVRRSMEKFISLGVEIGVTELDITAGSNNELTEQEANEQAFLYAQLFQLYKEHSDHISRVTFWGLNDASSWRAEQSPLLFDKDLQAKPAYYAVIDPDTFIEEYEHREEEKEARQGEALFGTPVIDGKVDQKWDNAPALPIDRYQMAWQGADGNAKALWDNENLYVLFQVSDSQLDKSSENAYEQDSVEVFLDENNAKTTFYEEDDGQYRVNFDNETTFNPAQIADGFKSATNVSGNGYTVEMKIPFKSITPEENIKIGFDAQVNDGQDGSRQSVAIWNDLSGGGFQDTSVFGELTLVKAPEQKPVPEPEEPGKGDSDDPKPENPGEEKPKPDGSETEKSKQVVTKPIVENKQATIEDDAAVNSLAEEGELIIDLSDNDSSVEINLTKEQVQQLKRKNALVTINKADVSIQIPASVFIHGDESVLVGIQKLQDIDHALSAVYDFNIIQGGKVIDQFDSSVTLTFKVDDSRINHPDRVKIFHWNPKAEENGGIWELTGGEYKDHYVTAETEHFSIFTVFETEDEQTTVSGEEESSANKLPNTATSTFNYLLAGLLLMLTGILYYIIRRKRA